MKEFVLTPDDIQKGAQCPSCNALPMQRSRRGQCRTCGHQETHAHKQALQDYLHLFGHTISNEQCRNFLHLPSIQVSLRILHSLNLSHNNKNKGRRFDLSSLEGENQLGQ